MAEMEPIENLVKRDRIAASKRPELKRPIGGLNQIKDHVYAYSGAVSLSSSTQKVQILFTTGFESIKGHFVLTGPTSESNPSGERDSIFRIQFNGATIAYCQRLAGSSLISNGETTIRVIIPPYTKVEVGCRSSGSDSDYFTACIFTGEVI